MGKRLIATLGKQTDKSVKVYRDSEWDEWQVQEFSGTQCVGTSFHSDKEDAMSTAHYIDNRSIIR